MGIAGLRSRGLVTGGHAHPCRRPGEPQLCSGPAEHATRCPEGPGPAAGSCQTVLGSRLPCLTGVSWPGTATFARRSDTSNKHPLHPAETWPLDPASGKLELNRAKSGRPHGRSRVPEGPGGRRGVQVQVLFSNVIFLMSSLCKQSTPSPPGSCEEPEPSDCGLRFPWADVQAAGDWGPGDFNSFGFEG